MVECSGILVSKRFQLIAVAFVLVAVLAVAIILYDFSSGPSHSSSSASESGQLSNAGQVFLSEGSNYPKIVDLIGGSLNATDNSLEASVAVGGAVSSLSEGESVQWNILLVLENQTSTLKTYTVSLELNSSGFFGVWMDVASGTAVPCNATYVGSSLIVQANVNLGGVTIINWNVNSIYQNFSNGVLVAYATDTAPAVGFATLDLPS